MKKEDKKGETSEEVGWEGGGVKEARLGSLTESEREGVSACLFKFFVS